MILFSLFSKAAINFYSATSADPFILFVRSSLALVISNAKWSYSMARFSSSKPLSKSMDAIPLPSPWLGCFDTPPGYPNLTTAASDSAKSWLEQSLSDYSIFTFVFSFFIVSGGLLMAVLFFYCSWLTWLIVTPISFPCASNFFFCSATTWFFYAFYLSASMPVGLAAGLLLTLTELFL